MKNWIRQHFVFLSILLFYLLLFLPFIGMVHLFDWDEINFAEAAREMIVSGDWFNVQINFEPFWEKPPFFIWLQALSMKIFGVNEFAARFPNVIVGLVTLIVLYFPLLKRYGKQAAIFSLLFYLGSFTPHFYFKSGIIDPLFNLFIYLGALFLVQSVEAKARIHFFYAGLFLGFAVVTKGPVALLLVGLTGLVYQIYYRINFYSLRSIGLLISGLLLVLGIIFGLQVYQNGLWFLKEFFIYQIDLFRYPIASHGQPFYYHFLILLVGCFPLFIFLFPSMIKRVRYNGDATLIRWMKVLFWVVLIVFSLVTTKIVHYSSMCYIPLAIVGGVWLSKTNYLSKVKRTALAFIGMFWFSIILITGILPYNYGYIKEWLLIRTTDTFLIEQLNTQVEWSVVPMFLSILFGFTLVRLVLKSSKINVASFLVSNTLVITLLINSVVPPLEGLLQGKWINQLRTYNDKEMMHFTLGFKSYAHKFYTQQKKFADASDAKSSIMKDIGVCSLTNLGQNDKKRFDNAVRDFVILETEIPISLSVKQANFSFISEKYPDLHMVFHGNGYGVWERKD